MNYLPETHLIDHLTWANIQRCKKSTNYFQGKVWHIITRHKPLEPIMVPYEPSVQYDWGQTKPNWQNSIAKIFFCGLMVLNSSIPFMMPIMTIHIIQDPNNIPWAYQLNANTVKQWITQWITVHFNSITHNT